MLDERCVKSKNQPVTREPAHSVPSRLEPSDLGLGRLFHRARDAVVVGNASDGRILLWNDAAVELFGYTAEEASSRLIEALVPEPLREQHRAGLSRYSTTGRGMLIDSGKPVELPALRKDGSIIQVELSLSPIDSGDLPGQYVMAIIRDVTERLEARHALEERTHELERSRADLERTLAELRAAHEEVKHVTAVAAHELGNPLTAVIGLTQVLRQGWEGMAEDRKKAILESMGRQAERLKRLSDDLLTASRIDSGTIEPRPEPVLIAEAIDEILADRDDRDVFSVRAPAEDRVLVDPRHFAQILTNYVGNAVKHGAPPFEIRAERSGAFGEIRVVDGGDGVPANVAGRLFGRFVRGSGGRPGAGLGLSIVRGLARANGGDAWVEPNAPHGAIFCVRFPVVAES